MTAAARLLVGNLDGEIELARASTPGPHPTLSAAAARLVGAAASHMALLARDGDRLWLPAPVPRDTLCPAARSRSLAIESGPLAELAPASELCAWSETAAVADLRRPRPHPTDPGAVTALAEASDWRAALWHLRPAPEVTAAVNHREFAFTLADRRGWSLPGACLIRDVAELERHLTGGGAAAGHERAWVVKAPLSAAGRERLRHRGDSLASAERARIERLLARFGLLLFEPWVSRSGDLACAGLVHAGGVRLFPCHLLVNDERGVFRAAVIDDDGATSREHRAAVATAAAAAGEALGAAGYRGPFSVDAYTWRDAGGATQLQRMSEINARLSFGLIARIAAEDAGHPRGPFELRP